MKELGPVEPYECEECGEPIEESATYIDEEGRKYHIDCTDE